MKAASCSTPPARWVSVVMTRTGVPARVARAANLAVVMVLPAPGGPTSMIGWPSPCSDSGVNVKVASMAPANAAIGSSVSTAPAAWTRRSARRGGVP